MAVTEVSLEAVMMTTFDVVKADLGDSCWQNMSQRFTAKIFNTPFYIVDRVQEGRAVYA